MVDDSTTSPPIPAANDGALVDVLDGCVLTHRLTETEVNAAMVAFAPDFLPFKDLDEASAISLAGGELLDHRHLGTTACAWAGPDGWLDGFVVDDLVALRLTAATMLVERVTNPVLTPDDTGVVAGVVEAQADLNELEQRPRHPVELELVALELAQRWAGPDSRVRPPLVDQVTATGFEVYENRVAPAGFDWPGWERTTRIGRLLAVYGLPATMTEEVLSILSLAEDTAAEPEALAQAATELTQPALAQLVADDLLGANGVAGVDAFATRLTVHAADDASRAAGLWLEARAIERAGRVVEAEEALERAVALAPDWAPALEDLAGYTGDRGDAKRTIDLLLRAGATSKDPTVVDLRDLVARGGDQVGRNDPCPCGSGKKFKVCHQGRGGIPLERRVGWLWNKAAAFAQRGPEALGLLDLARAYAGPEATNREVVDLAFGDGVVLDLALDEGGVMAAFVERRGALLPDDEATLVASWLETHRDLYRVDTVVRGRAVVLHELRSGLAVDLSDRAASRTARPGTLVVARLLPDGSGRRQMVGGGVIVPESAAEDLASYLGVRHAAVEVASRLGDAGRAANA